MVVYENTIMKPLFLHIHKPLQEYRANKTSPYKLYSKFKMTSFIQRRCKFPESKLEIAITQKAEYHTGCECTPLNTSI